MHFSPKVTKLFLGYVKYKVDIQYIQGKPQVSYFTLFINVLIKKIKY